MAAPAQQKIPALDLASKAFTHVGANTGPLLRAIGGWIAVYTGAYAAWFYGLIWLIQSNVGFQLWFTGFSERTQDLVVAFVPVLVTFVALPAVAVTWHRFMLLGEDPRGFIPFHAARIVQYTGRVMITLGLVALLFFFGIAPLLVLLAAVSPLLALVPLVIWALGIYIFVRTGLALPAAAIADSKWTLERSWNETQADGVALSGCTILVMLPFTIFRGLTGLFAATLIADQQLALFLAISILNFAAALVGVAVGAAFYSLVYEFMSRADGMADRPPASHFS